MAAVADFYYNTALLVLFTMVMSFAMCIYSVRKKAVYLPIFMLFLFYLVDTTIIYMTEILPNAASWYNTIFMSVPTFKTIIYLVTALCLLQLRNRLFGRRFSAPQIAVLISLGLWYLFIPMMENSALKVWLYYFAYQVFTLCFSLSSLRLLPNAGVASESLRKTISLFLKLTVLFSLLIAAEDTVVIFNLDIYSSVRIYIHDRNHCEDILRVLYSILILRWFYQERPQLATPRVLNSESGTVRSVAVDPRAAAFAQELRLTGRESEILYLLLENADNQEISRRLFISIGTVKTHVHNIFQKAEVLHRQELIQKYGAFVPEPPTT